jgi:AcrR family transcriptional regulator
MKGKEKIVKAAIQLFNKNGVHSVSTNHIAEELKMSPGNLYYHFHNKEEIIREIYQEMIHFMDDVWVRPSVAEPLETVIGKLDKTMKLQYRYRFFYQEIGVLLDKDPLLKKVYQENRKVRCEQMTGYFAYLEQEGFLNSIGTEGKLEKLTEVIWYLSELWLQHGILVGTTSAPKQIQQNMELMLFVMMPYIAEPYWDKLILTNKIEEVTP